MVKKQIQKRRDPNTVKLAYWDRHWSSIALVLIVCSIAVKMYWAYASPLSPTYSDAYGYHTFAEGVVRDKLFWHGSAIFKPGMPFYLTAVYALTGTDFHHARIGLIFVSLLFSWYVYRFAELYSGRSAARLAFAMSLFDPFVVHYATSEFGEMLMFTCVIAALYHGAVNVESPRWRDAVLVGVTVTLGTMFKAWLYVVFPIYAAYALLLRGWRRWRRVAAEFCVMVAVSFATSLPWFVYGYFLTGQFVLQLSSGPSMLFYGNNPYAVVHLPDAELVAKMNKLIPVSLEENMREFNRLTQAYAMDYIASHSWATLRKFVSFFVRYWSHPNRYWHQRQFGQFESTMTWMWGKWLTATIGCVFLARRDPKKQVLPLLFALAATGVYGLTAYLGRYKDILLPVQFVYCAAGFMILYRIFCKDVTPESAHFKR